MAHNITRRDYLNGSAMILASAALPACSQVSPTPSDAVSIPGLSSDYYPPLLNGLRGSHEGSYEVAHALAWAGEKPTEYTDLDDEYDLVVVGAGISGLAAAYLYRKEVGEDARILLLDNHGEFGGHAIRNEFESQGRMILGPGGSANFENANAYSKETTDLISELGFDLDRVRAVGGASFFGGTIGMFVEEPLMRESAIVHGDWNYAWHGVGNYQELVEALPLSEDEKAKLIGFIEGSRPLETPLPEGDLATVLRELSYRTFITEHVGLTPETCTLLEPVMRLTYLVGVDCLSVREGILSGLPGMSVLGEAAFAALDLPAEDEGYDIVWMPDGNASLARQLVRRLIPQVASGSTIDDLLTARFDYSQLDQPGRPVQLRLNSTVVNVQEAEDQTVSVAYVQQGEAFRVKAKRCILACYNALIPHLCPDLPDAQKENLAYSVKGPMVIANVLLKNGRAFYSGGSEMYYCPASPFDVVTKAPPTSLGDYQTSNNPDDPMVVYMLAAPAPTLSDDAQSARDLYRQGRHALYTKPFEAFEEEIKGQLTRLFGANGFDAGSDIEAITINRWSHGYAYSGFELFDPKWPEGGAPHELGRKAFGRISIANSDSEAVPTLEAAINAAHRAVQEQLA